MTDDNTSDMRLHTVPLGDIAALAARYESATTDRWLGKRGWPRTAMVSNVSVRLPAEGGYGPPCEYTLRDISATGIGLYSYRALPEDAVVLVELTVNDLSWCGEMRVLHCTETVGGYKVGLESLEAPPEATTTAGQTGHESPPPPSPEAGDVTPLLPQIRAQAADAARTYRLARRSLGLLGSSVRKRIRQVMEQLRASAPAESGAPATRPGRMRADSGACIIVRMAYGWRRVPGRILDISENGLGLIMPSQLVSNMIEREMVGDLPVHVGMTLIVGLGADPDVLWIPGEVVHCSPVVPRSVHVGIAFGTPASLQSLDD